MFEEILEKFTEALDKKILDTFNSLNGFKETTRINKGKGIEHIKLKLKAEINHKEVDGNKITTGLTISGSKRDIELIKEDEYGVGSKNIAPKANLLKLKNRIIIEAEKLGAKEMRSK